MLNVQDVLSELDILAYDSEVLTTFGATTSAVSANLDNKRRVAVDDWLYNGLIRRGYSPEKHSVRFAPDQVWGYTGGTYTDLTDAAKDNTASDINPNTVLASAGTDALYVGMSQPFAGLWVTILDTPNINTLTGLQAAYWNGGQWSNVNSLVDGTSAVSSLALSGGGRVSWQMPTTWQPRPLNGEDWRFWVKLTTTRQPSAATRLTHLLPIRRSRLTAPAAIKALSLLYAESWGVQNGQWREKSDEYAKMADLMLEAATRDLMEFMTEPEQAVVPTTAPAPDPSLFTLERG